MHDGANTAYYGIDSSYLVSGLLASGQAFSRSGRWSAHGNQRTLYFDDGDWRRDFLVVTPQGKTRFVSDGGMFVGGAPRPKGGVGYLTFCGEACDESPIRWSCHESLPRKRATDSGVMRDESRG